MGWIELFEEKGVTRSSVEFEDVILIKVFGGDFREIQGGAIGIQDRNPVGQSGRGSPVDDTVVGFMVCAKRLEPVIVSVAINFETRLMV